MSTFTLSNPAHAMSIAGSEATGGAGAQADLKTFQELGVYGSLALTCIVSFDPKTEWGHRFVPVSTDVIADQIEAIRGDYPTKIRTTKLGMMGSVATVETVAASLDQHEWDNIVLDPVLICKGQEPGAAQDTDEALKDLLLPRATFVTPNHFEAEQLSGRTITDQASLIDAAKAIFELNGVAVLAKGGVRLSGDDAIDVYYDGDGAQVLSAPKIGEHAVSGAGCTLAAVVTAELAKGATPLEAATRAKEFTTAGIRQRVTGQTPFDALWQGGLRGESLTRVPSHITFLPTKIF